MVKRYLGAVGAGLLVTGALIFWMQRLIAAGKVAVEPYEPVRVALSMSIPKPPPPRTPRTPPVKQEPIPFPSTPSFANTITAVSNNPISSLPPRAHAFGHGRIGFPGIGPGPFGSSGNGGALMQISRIQPLYPHAAELRGIEGRVVVEFTVMPEGTVADLRIVESTDPVFDKAALDAAARFRYRQRVVDGTPIAVLGVRTAFDFQLEN